MSKINKNKLLPRLRFPEFQNDGKWEVKRLGELCVEIKEKTNGRKFKLLSISSGQGLISQIEKFGKEIAGNSYSNYTVIRKNDFAYNKSSTKSYPEGEIALMEEEEDCAVPNSIFTCFRFKQNLIIPYFAKYLFVKNHHGRYLRTLIAIGARAHGALQISTRDLFSVPIPFPSLPEQQKIASCLSSLDELIEAESQKLELYQQHKKGLLQNLFPQEGETVPKLRFPEFTETWDKDLLGNIAKDITTGKLDANAMTEDGQYRFYTCAKNYYKIDRYAFDKEALLIAGNGAYLGYIHYYNGKFNAYQRTYVLSDFTHNVIYLKYFLERFLPKRINLEKKDGNTPYIVLSTLTEMEIFFPNNPKEQQKIADCLSSLDEIITAQTQKIALLQQHKKGLLQGLFPTINDEE